jgi:hypothetical protein
MLESGKLIRNIQVYESKTHRIPVQYIARDFYRFFRLAGIITINYIWLLFGFEIGLFNSGLFYVRFYTPIVIGNAIEIGEIIHTQERVGRMIVFAILKFRSMRNNCENGAVFLQR